MRDPVLLRRRLHTALTTGLLLAACGQPSATPTPQPAPPPAKVDTPAPPPAKSEPPAPVAVAPVEGPQYPARTGQDPFDPDGLEEEGCPNGDWCGSPQAAEVFKSPQAEVEIGCPTRLIGKPNNGINANDRTYKGLSLNPMMMGRLRKIATADKRAATKDAEICCYHWFDYCSGRPLLTDDGDGSEAVAAPLRSGSTWLGDHVPEDMLEGTPIELRPTLAAAWLADAQMEHASVAAFARAALELLAVGAPPELVAGCSEAGLDEVRHARLCFALAAAYGGEAMEPGPLPPVLPRAGGLVALACDTFREGCVGETIAALTALRGFRGCRVPAVAAALQQIADDETRHAELAWATVAWAVELGGVEVARAVADVAAALRAEAFADADADVDSDGDLDLVTHGRLDSRARTCARRDAWTGILDRMLTLVLSDSDAAPLGAAEPRAELRT